MKKIQESRFSETSDFVELVTEDRLGYCDPEDVDLFMDYGSEDVQEELEKLETEIKRTNK